MTRRDGWGRIAAGALVAVSLLPLAGCRPSRTVSWTPRPVPYGDAAFRSRLRELGAYILPDPSTLTPSGIITLDGVSILVEVLEAGRYHSYSYSNPWAQPWPEAETAAAIMELTTSLRPAIQWSDRETP